MNENLKSLPDFEKPQSERWSTNPLELINQIETYISTDSIDNRISAEESGGMRLGMKDALRQIRFQVFRQLFLLDELTKESHLIDETKLAEHLSHFDENDVQLIGNTAQTIFKNWKEYVTKKDIETVAGQIACEVYAIAYEYLLTQANTQLGEALKYDPELVSKTTLDPLTKLALEKFISGGHGLQQREFGNNYFLGKEMLPSMIQSSIRRENLPASSSREHDERWNLQELYRRLDSPLGTIVVEVSPPFHSHQDQTMIRFYKMTPSGWIPTIFYVPHIEVATDDLMQEYFKNLTDRNIDYSLINTNSTVPLFGVKSGVSVEQLANLFPLISRIAVSEYGISGVDLMRAGDMVIKPQMDQVMPSIHAVITEVLNDFPNIMAHPERLDQATAKFERLIHSINISLQSEKELKRQGHSQKDITAIKSGELLKAARTANSDISFNMFVDKTFDKPLRSEMRSDCQNSRAQFGGKSEMGGVSKEMPLGTSMNKVIGKDGTRIEFMQVNGETHIDKCPMCGYRGERHPTTKRHLGIDICNTNCPNCNENMQGMRKMFEQGTLQDYKKSKNNSQTRLHSSKSSPSRQISSKVGGKYQNIPFKKAINDGLSILTMGLFSSQET